MNSIRLETRRDKKVSSGKKCEGQVDRQAQIANSAAGSFFLVFHNQNMILNRHLK